MSILSGFRKQKRYTTDDKGRHQLISTWTHTDTVYDDEGKSLTEIIEELPAADTKVKQIATDDTNKTYEVLFSESSDNVTKAEESRKSKFLSFNPFLRRLLMRTDNFQTSTGGVGTVITPADIQADYAQFIDGSHIHRYRGTLKSTSSEATLTLEHTDTTNIPNVNNRMVISPTDIKLQGTTWDGSYTSLKTALANAGAKVLYGTSAPTSAQGEDGQLYVKLKPTDPYLNDFTIDYSEMQEVDTGLDIRDLQECNVNVKQYQMVSDVETLVYEYNNVIDFSTDVGESYYVEDDEENIICLFERNDWHADPPDPQNLGITKHNNSDKLIITITDAEVTADAIESIYIKNDGEWLKDDGGISSPTASDVDKVLKATDEGEYGWEDINEVPNAEYGHIGKYLKATATGEYAWADIPKDALFIGASFFLGEVTLPTGLGVTLANTNVPVFIYNTSVTTDDYGKIYHPVAIDGAISLHCRENAEWQCISTETVNGEDKTYVEKIVYHMNGSSHEETVTYTKEEISGGGGNAVHVPPVIYDNGNLKKIADMTGFPELEKVYLTPTAYSNLTTAQKEDLSKIYYVSDYEFHIDPDHPEVVVRVGSNNEVKWFFSGYTFAGYNRYEVPESLRQYQPNNGTGSVRVDSTPYASASSTEPINQNYFVGWSNLDQANKVRYSSITGSVSILNGTVYAVIDSNGSSGQTNPYSDPFDVPNGFTIYYGNKQYTDFDIPDPLPSVDSTDNGKVLKVVSGAWAADTIPTGLEVVKLSQTAYDSLSDAQKKNGKMYLIDASIFTGGIPRVSGADSKITASSPSGNYYQPWLAFDGNDHTPGSDNDGWAPSNGDDQWIKYQFATATPINKIQFKAVSRNTTAWSGTIYIEGSNDDTTWENILKNKLSITTELPARSSSSVEFNEDANGKSYTYIRLRINNQSYQKFMLAEFDADITTSTYDSIYYMDRQYSTMYEPVPEVTMADAGKALVVNSDGEWDKGDIPSTCTPVEIEAADYHALTTPQKEDPTKVYFVKAGRVITDPVSVIPRNPSSSKIGNNTDGSSYATSATLAFDGVMNTAYGRVDQIYDATGWTPGYGNTVESAWISYEFDTAISSLTTLEVYAWNMATTSPETTWTTPVIVEGSTDGTTWFNILADGASSFTLSSKESEFVKNVIPLDNTVSVNYIRFRFLNRVNYFNDITFAIAEIYAYTGNVIKYDDSTYYKGIKHGKTIQELPDLVVADEGKVLKAVNGKWSKSDIYVECTQAEYDLLPSSKNSDGIIYFITDNS